MLTSFCEKSTQKLACYFNDAGKVTRMWDRIMKGCRHCYLVLSQEGWTKGSETWPCFAVVAGYVRSGVDWRQIPVCSPQRKGGVQNCSDRWEKRLPLWRPGGRTWVWQTPSCIGTQAPADHPPSCLCNVSSHFPSWLITGRKRWALKTGWSVLKKTHKLAFFFACGRTITPPPDKVLNKLQYTK